MCKSAIFIATALSGVLAFSANAGPLGGLGGGLGGSIGGGLGGGLGGVGGLSGTLNGTLNGSLDVRPDLSPVERAAMEARAQARAEARRAKVEAKRAAAAAKASANATAAISGAVTVAPDVRAVRGLVSSVAVLPPVAVIEAPALGLRPAEVRVVRERQSDALIEGGVTVLDAPQSYIYMDRQADDLRHELAGTGVEVTRQGRMIVLEMPADVTFAFDKSDIRSRFFPALDALARTLDRYPATYVDVIGHTDAIGSVPYNQALSERRAESVADFIQARERIPARLYVTGRGKSEPIASNVTIEGRAANRRVEILLTPYTRG